MTAETSIVSIISGQFLRDKIHAAVQFFGEHSFIDTLQEVEKASADLILLDLEHPQALDVLKSYGSKVIAFGPHTKQDLTKISRNFGAQTYTRSEFLDTIHQILSERI